MSLLFWILPFQGIATVNKNLLKILNLKNTFENNILDNIFSVIIMILFSVLFIFRSICS